MTAIPQPTRADESASYSRWVARTWLSRLVRLAIWLIPVVLSVMVIAVAARVWPPAELGMSVLVWWVVFAAIAMAVLVFTDRIARRFLPLSMLLRMALVFPDQAPSRFGAALRYGTAKKLLNRNPPTSHALMSLVRAISHHDRATRGHSERVRAYSQLIGQEMRLAQRDLDRLSWAALLHDVGKLDVSPEILNKKGDPDDAEWESLRQHPARAPAYLVGFEHWMGDWGRAASEHHERWDGKGYPQGLAGEEIHQAGRIVAVADAYDVMTSVRSYKKSMPTGMARQEIGRHAGAQFDPTAVRAFLNVGIGQVNTKWGAFAWVTQIPDMVSRAPAAGLIAIVAVGASLGLIDPGKGAVNDPVAAIERVEDAEGANSSADADADAVIDPTPTPTPTVTPTDSAAGGGGDGDGGDGNGGDGDGDSGDGDGDGADGDGDGDGGDGDGGDGDGADGSGNDDDPDGGDADSANATGGDADPSLTPAPTPAAGNPDAAGTSTTPPASGPRPTPTATGAAIPTPTQTPTPTPTVNPVFELLGGVPTVEPTVDPFGPPAPGGVPSPPRVTATPTPVATATPTVVPSPTPTATAVPTPTATPVPPTPTPTPTPPPILVSPLAADDSFLLVPSGVEVVLQVLINDSAQSGSPLDSTTLTITIGPLHSDPAFPNANGPHFDHIDYQSLPGYTGPDSFEYQICNSDGLCDTAFVTIQVVP